MSSDLMWGLGMTVAGMGTVFALLLLLMVMLLLIGRLDRPALEAGPQAPAVGGATAVAALDAPPADGAETTTDTDTGQDEPAAPAVRILADGLTEDELAAITVAVLTHRDTRRHQAAPEQRAHQPGSQLYASRWVSVGRAQQTQPWRRK